MNTPLLHRCTREPLIGTMTLSEVVAHMIDSGIERYVVDLVAGTKLFQSVSGETHFEVLPWQGDSPADPFDAAAVEGAIGALQCRTIGYPEFLERIVAAGTVAYSVHVPGRMAAFFGRRGDIHVEPFPGRDPRPS